MIKMICCFCKEEMKMENGAGHFCETTYYQPAKTEEFMAGDAICPSCGCKSLYKTARSEWCVTRKCLWQKDYELTLTNEEIWACHDSIDSNNWVIDFARAILRKAQENG